MASTRIQTIADIARVAGVSKATVSRALNDSPLIAAETKERIRAIAAEHDFQLNVPARRLSTKRSHVVALPMHAYRPEMLPDAFMLEIIGGITGALAESDYDLLVVNMRPGDTEPGRGYLQSGRADGLILLSGMCTPRQIEALFDMKAPFIVWGTPAVDREGFCSVSGDSVNGGRIATEHLAESGRRRIAFLGGPPGSPEVRDRLLGYEQALRASDLEFDDALVAHIGWDDPEAEAPAAVAELLERAPDLDAIFANSDLMAIPALDALREHGRSVPDDVAVVGYDDIAVARHTNPSLTTIRQNGPLAGRLLAQNLLQHVATGVVTNVLIPAELVVRASS